MRTKHFWKSYFMVTYLVASLVVAPLAGCSRRESVSPHLQQKTSTHEQQKTSYGAAIIEVISGIVGMFLVSSCGSSTSSALLAITGVAQMGRMVDAEVKYCLASDMADNDSCDSPVVTGTTDSTGAYNLSVAAQTEPMIIEVSGKPDGSTYYVDEADGTKVTVADNETLEVVVADPSVAGEYPATPFTKTAYQMVKNQLGTEMSGVSIDHMKTYSENAYKQTAEAFGISDYTTLKAIPANPGDPSASMNAAAFAMGQYSKFLDQNNISPANAMVAVDYIAKGFKDGSLSTSDMPAAYQGLATAFENSTTGFLAAAAAYVSDPQCPKGLGAVYTANSAQWVAPDSTPQNYVGAAYDYNKSKDAAVTAGKTFVDPCDPASLNKAACPKPEYIAAGDYKPATYDTFKNTNNATVTYGVPTGVTGYTGSGESQYSFKAPPSSTDYKAGNYTPPTGGIAYTSLFAQCDVSSTTGTITLKKTDGTAPSSLIYTYAVKRYVEGTGMVAGATGSGTSTSFTISLSTAGNYMIEVALTSPSPQNVMMSCYKP